MTKRELQIEDSCCQSLTQRQLQHTIRICQIWSKIVRNHPAEKESDYGKGNIVANFADNRVL